MAKKTIVGSQMGHMSKGKGPIKATGGKKKGGKKR